MIDTLRNGISGGKPGSQQRIADLVKYYAGQVESGISPFDDQIAMSYAAESVMQYNHQRIDDSHCVAYAKAQPVWVEWWDIP